MLSRILSPNLRVPIPKLVPFGFILAGLISSCIAAPLSSPSDGEADSPQATAAGDSTPTAQVLESTPTQTSVNETTEISSGDQLGLCFSYPQGYSELPYNDSVQIVAPSLGPGAEVGLFWLEISDSYNRTAEKIAEQDMTFAAGLSVGRWNLTLDGEQAVVLDGMPGQDLVRRVYAVHQQTLYILTFSPTRSENAAAGEQMETLYDLITNSWAWSPCSEME